MSHLIGAHTIDNGGIDMAARRAGAAGMRALQIFTAIPKYYNEKVGVRPERAERFRAALADTAIDPQHVIAHAAYVINVATGDETKWGRAAAALAKELERAEALGIRGVCFHPGSAGAAGERAAAVARVADAIARALGAVRGRAMLFVENTAGAGATIGKTPEEVGGILAAIPSAHADRAGYGLDTCHLHSAGFEIAASPRAQAAVLDAFEEATGRRPSFFHLNDSAGALGSNKDRHELIGEGTIGEAPFGWLLADRRSAGVPLILETPQQHPEIADDDPTPDPYDVRMVSLLEALSPA
jgi:deoxyribonuclease-4